MALCYRYVAMLITPKFVGVVALCYQHSDIMTTKCDNSHKHNQSLNRSVTSVSVSVTNTIDFYFTLMIPGETPM